MLGPAPIVGVRHVPPLRPNLRLWGSGWVLVALALAGATIGTWQLRAGGLRHLICPGDCDWPQALQTLTGTRTAAGMWFAVSAVAGPLGLVMMTMGRLLAPPSRRSVRSSVPWIGLVLLWTGFLLVMAAAVTFYATQPHCLPGRDFCLSGDARDELGRFLATWGSALRQLWLSVGVGWAGLILSGGPGSNAPRRIPGRADAISVRAAVASGSSGRGG